MKLINNITILIIILIISFSCDNLQKNIEDKAKEIHETADKEINEQLLKVDSTFNQLDTTIQKKIDGQLEKADSLFENIHDNLKK
jgi:hypothetical protein